MCGFLRLLLCVVLFIFRASNAGLLTKNKISLTKVEFISSDPSIMDMKLEAKQVSEDVVELSGYILFTKTVDTETFDDMKALTSTDSLKYEDMKPVPFLVVPKKSTYEFMNEIYKPIIMPTVKGCSDMPVFEDDWGDRSLAGKYTLNNCVLKTDGLQPLLSKGNKYCLVAVIKRDVEPKFLGELRAFIEVD